MNTLYHLKILPYKMNDKFQIMVATSREWYILNFASIFIQVVFDLTMLKSVFYIKQHGMVHFVFCFTVFSLSFICSLGQVFLFLQHRCLASIVNTFIKLNDTVGKSTKCCIFILATCCICSTLHKHDVIKLGWIY